MSEGQTLEIVGDTGYEYDEDIEGLYAQLEEAVAVKDELETELQNSQQQVANLEKELEQAKKQASQERKKFNKKIKDLEKSHQKELQNKQKIEDTLRIERKTFEEMLQTERKSFEVFQETLERERQAAAASANVELSKDAKPSDYESEIKRLASELKRVRSNHGHDMAILQSMFEKEKRNTEMHLKLHIEQLLQKHQKVNTEKDQAVQLLANNKDQIKRSKVTLMEIENQARLFDQLTKFFSEKMEFKNQHQEQEFVLLRSHMEELKVRMTEAKEKASVILQALNAINTNNSNTVIFQPQHATVSIPLTISTNNNNSNTSNGSTTSRKSRRGSKSIPIIDGLSNSNTLIDTKSPRVMNPEDEPSGEGKKDKSKFETVKDIFFKKEKNLPESDGELMNTSQDNQGPPSVTNRKGVEKKLTDLWQKKDKKSNSNSTTASDENSEQHEPEHLSPSKSREDSTSSKGIRRRSVSVGNGKVRISKGKTTLGKQLEEADEQSSSNQSLNDIRPAEATKDSAAESLKPISENIIEESTPNQTTESNDKPPVTIDKQIDVPSKETTTVKKKGHKKNLSDTTSKPANTNNSKDTTAKETTESNENQSDKQQITVDKQPIQETLKRAPSESNISSGVTKKTPRKKDTLEKRVSEDAPKKSLSSKTDSKKHPVTSQTAHPPPISEIQSPRNVAATVAATEPTALELPDLPDGNSDSDAEETSDKEEKENNNEETTKPKKKIRKKASVKFRKTLERFVIFQTEDKEEGMNTNDNNSL